MQGRILQEHACELLDAGKVECIIGYEVSPRGKTRPVFVYDKKAAEKLTWNNHATFNLTTYLRGKLSEIEGRVAVVLKPCDMKALNVLISQGKIERSRIHSIGVNCGGIVRSESDQTLQARCIECDQETSFEYDFLVADRAITKSSASNIQEKWTLDAIKELTPEEKFEFWLDQFDRCLRCYACRQVCPVCDCPTCLFERDDSLWVGAGSGVQEKRTFHLGRAFHLAGRCAGCNECERVCPVNIPISLLNQKLAEEIEIHFGYQPGYEVKPSPLVTVISGEEKWG